MKKANLRISRSIRREISCKSRGYSPIPEGLYHELTSRQLPLFFDYLHPQPSHLLDLTLSGLFPRLVGSSCTETTLPSIARPLPLPPAHHLVYFPPQVTLSQLLGDGTDTLHSPGAPFNRRLWAGGSVEYASKNKLLLDGSRAVCIEGIRNVTIKGQPGEEKITIKVERRIGTAPDGERPIDTRNRIWSGDQGVETHASIIENRNLVFMRDRTADQLDQDQSRLSQSIKTIKSPTNSMFRYQIKPTKALLFRYSALTFNAHLIHLDEKYARGTEGYRNLLVHGPLTLTFLLTALRQHLHGKRLAFKEIEYKNLAPVYVEEELAICGKPKPDKEDSIWDVWIEGKDGGLAVRGTVHLIILKEL